MGRVNSPGAGKMTDEALLSHTNPLIGIDFFLVIGKEGAWLCYRKGRDQAQSQRRLSREGMGNRQGLLLCWRNEGLNSASDSLSRSGFPTPRETGRDR